MHDNRLARFREWLRDAPILAGLWLLAGIAGPHPETEADRIREQEKDRLRRAFPALVELLRGEIGRPVPAGTGPATAAQHPRKAGRWSS